MPDALVTFVHLSDTHLPADPNFTPDGKRYPYRNARAVIEQINALPFPVDFVLHTGDVGNDQTDDAGYQPVRETLDALRPPLYVIPGNHDLPESLYRVVAGRAAQPTWYDFDVNGTRFLCLNTVVPKAGYGVAGEEQLAWLNAHLAEATDVPVVIAMHHHPFPTDSAAMDAYVMHDGAALHASIAAARDRVRCVLFGHIHETTMFVRDGVIYAAAPATSLQLRSWPGQQEITPDAVQAPGFNVVAVRADGTVLIRNWRAALD